MSSHINIISKRELRSYFNSPSAYIVLVFFLILSGWFFTSPLFINNQANLSSLFNIIPILFLFFVPAITMSTIAKEKNSGTIEIITTLPLRDSEIIMGKFWASLGLVVVGLLFTLVHFITIVILGSNIDFGAIATGYFGMILLSAVYVSIGIFASSLTSNQIVAFIISFFICFFFFILDYSLMFIPSSLVGIFQFLSVNYHLSNITKGVIDTRNLIYFLSLTIFFLRLSILIMESRKWK